MKNKIQRLYFRYSWYWETFLPSKPRYGDYRGRGRSGRWRKIFLADSD